jgi:hypothetical protein
MLQQQWITVSMADMCRTLRLTYVDIHLWAPSQKPGLKHQIQDNPLIREIFPDALQNVELFEAIVALCLSSMAAGRNFQTHLYNMSLYHKGKAMAGIRSKLMSGHVDEAVIVATVFLMMIDVSSASLDYSHRAK